MVLKQKIADQIKDLLRKNPHGLSITEIVESQKINRNTAGRYLENLLISGQVELRRFGMAKIYRISQRIPLSAVLSVSTELVVQLDSFLRIIFANESFCELVGTDSSNLVGKNIEYTSVALVFDEIFVGFVERIREGLAGTEWTSEIELKSKGVIVFCQIAPTVFEDGRKGVSIILEDISRRKHAERALLESEATARALMNSPTDTVILMDSRGIILDLNDTAVSKFKKHRDELIGILSDTLLPKEIAQSRRILTTQVIVKKQMVRYEDERDGRWYDTVAYPIMVNGEVTRIAMIARDITDRKNAEDALRESENRLRLILDSTNDIVIMQDPEGRYLYFNPAAWYGVSMDEIIGATPYDILGKEAADRIVERMKNVVKTGRGIREETPIVWRDQTLWFSDSLSPVKNTNGIVTAVVTVSQNITERKCAEMALRESEEEYRNIFENAIVGFFRTTPEGALTKVNHSFARMYGYDNPDETISDTKVGILQYADPDDRKDVLRELNETGVLKPREIRVRHKDGHIFWALVSARSVKGEDGTIRYIDGTHIDITARKQAEDALRESELRLRLMSESTEDLTV